MSNQQNTSDAEVDKAAFWNWLQSRNKKPSEQSYEPIQLEIELPLNIPTTSSYESNETGIINYEIDHDIYSSGSVVLILAGK